MTTLTPPPETPAVAEVPAARPPRNGSARVIAILTIALGAALILGAVTAGIVRTVAASATTSETRTLAVDGVSDLDIVASAVDLTVVFADVDEATLDIVEGRGGWRFEREDDELRVESPRGPWFGGFWFGGNGRATLTLPTELDGSDAAMRLSAGSLTADGSFGDLDLEVSAGDLSVTGEARSLSTDLNAGSADLRLDGVTEADFSLSAGRVDARLAGTVPRSVQIDVSAGSLSLGLPSGDYDVRSDVSAGNLDNRLERGSGARGTIDVTLSAGEVRLGSAR